MHYYLIIALQGFCIYHSIKNRNNYYWIFLIIFLPLVGSVIYLLTQVFSKRDAKKISNEITTIINPTKKVKDLEQKLKFSDTYQNRVDLADAYFQIHDFDHAIFHYQKALEDKSQNNDYIKQQLIAAYFNKGDFKDVINFWEQMNEGNFKNSESEFLYGMALYKSGFVDKAEQYLRNVDKRYSNYEERLQLSKFLFEIGKESDAKEILNEIYAESQHMTKINKRKYRTTILEVEKLLRDT
ncbi:hypothetical protein [Hanstruepera flava]|uniref:hypothetical protein n=1 Tax=Hanstruepera flava TaxID=2930218 RepID=UPI00202827F3|nr:hypothetical protein [Hanstruepera flava]